MSDSKNNGGSKSGGNESVNEMSDDKFSALQQEIKTIYQQQNLERPPEAIDAAILAQAKLNSKNVKSNNVYGSRAQANVVKVSFWNRHRVGLSTAASVMVVASVMLLNPNFNQHAIIDADDGIPLLPSSEQVMPMSMATVEPLLDEPASTESAMEPQLKLDIEQRSEQMNPSSMPLSRSGFTDPVMDITPNNGANLQQIPSNETSSSRAQINTSERSQVKMQATQVDSDFFAAPIMAQDSAPKAIMRLAELVDNNQLEQAERYLLTIEQRFPNIVNTEHPQHQQYQQLKILLTTQ